MNMNIDVIGHEYDVYFCEKPQIGAVLMVKNHTHTDRQTDRYIHADENNTCQDFGPGNKEYRRKNFKTSKNSHK